MKYLDIPELSSLTSFLTSCELGSRRIKGRIEAYSCKQTGQDKELGKQLEQTYIQEIEESSQGSLATSPLGTLSDPQTRRLLINLICTMNASFPDYDFSTLRPEQFLKENLGMVVNAVNIRFAEIVENIRKGFLKQLWGAIDNVVGLSKAQVYSYIPNIDNDPFNASGNLWSFNFFFFNRAEKKIVFFACSCKQSPRFAALTPEFEIEDNVSTASVEEQEYMLDEMDRLEEQFYLEEEDVY